MINLDALSIKLFEQENSGFFKGAKIQKIQQLSRSELLFYIRNNGETKKFYINFNPQIYHICFISKETAEEIANFAKEWWNKVDQIVVHCDGGVSRSAGVAAAILKYFTGDDSEIFDNPNYYPNMLVYRMVLNALMEEE